MNTSWPILFIHLCVHSAWFLVDVQWILAELAQWGRARSPWSGCLYTLQIHSAEWERLNQIKWAEGDRERRRERERERKEGRRHQWWNPLKMSLFQGILLHQAGTLWLAHPVPPPPQPSDKACLFHSVRMPQFNDPSHWPLFLKRSLLWPPSLLSSWSHFMSHNYSSGWLLGSQNAEVTLLIAVNSFKSLLTFNYECLQLACQGVTFCCRRKQAQEAEK